MAEEGLSAGGVEVSAQEVVAAMHARDTTAKGLGITIVEADPGVATCEMKITDRHVGDRGVVHGGMLFTFADVAMSYAGNSYNIAAVATGANISFVDAGHPGETLIATAVEHNLRGKVGIYDVAVRCAEDDRLIATFRGSTLQIGGPVLTLGT